MRVDILSLFPEVFAPVLGASIPGIAQKKGLLKVCAHDIRAYTDDKHCKVDDRPFGGGPGMVIRCQPVVDAVAAVRAMASPPGRLILLTPAGRVFDQARAREFAAEERLLLVCGRYEGFDERILQILNPELVSLGDYVLSGGEIAAMAVVDAVCRLLPGVLGCSQSAQQESFSTGLLDHPHYTQPAEYRGLRVPEVLRSGDHARIASWRAARARERTHRLRPDLLADTDGA